MTKLVSFSQRLLQWYKKNARILPWRNTNDPYAIWVSEIMLQQTQVNTVIPYYINWMERFPTLHELAASAEKQVLSAWEGLGYYSRARNLLRSAQILKDSYNGKLPANQKELMALPGIGRYTACAILSLAYGCDVATLDANIRRVLSRIFNIRAPAKSPTSERILWKLAQEHLPAGKAGAYNQALMELGALVCTPKAPRCNNCPLADACAANRMEIQYQLPVLPKKMPVPHITVTAAVIFRKGDVLIARRPSKGLLGGMWEFPGGKLEIGETLEKCLAREICEELGVKIKVGKPIGTYRHAYSHFKVTLHAFWCNLPRNHAVINHETEHRWVDPMILSEFPMGKLDRLISKEILNKV